MCPIFIALTFSIVNSQDAISIGSASSELSNPGPKAYPFSGSWSSTRWELASLPGGHYRVFAARPGGQWSICCRRGEPAAGKRGHEEIHEIEQH